MKNNNHEVFYSEVPGGLGLIVMHGFNTGTLRAAAYAKLIAKEQVEGQYLSYEAENIPENREILFDAARTWVNGFLFKSVYEGTGIVLERDAFPKGYEESDFCKVVNSKKLLHLCLYHADFITLILNTIKSTRFRDLLQNLDEFSGKIKIESLS